MLKIKKERIKELENFGFEYDEKDKVWEYDCEDNTSYVVVFVEKYVSEIDESLNSEECELGLTTGCYGDFPETYFSKQLDILYELIMAGLVEKVD